MEGREGRWVRAREVKGGRDMRREGVKINGRGKKGREECKKK